MSRYSSTDRRQMGERSAPPDHNGRERDRSYHSGNQPRNRHSTERVSKSNTRPSVGNAFHLEPLNISSNTTSSRVEREVEDDAHRVENRQKQIEIGKATPGYEKYLTSVPKSKRVYNERFGRHPLTPPYHLKMSNRKFKGLMDQWRALLHGWDADGEGFASKEEMKQVRNQRHMDQMVEDRHTQAPVDQAVDDGNHVDDADEEALRLAAEFLQSYE